MKDINVKEVSANGMEKLIIELPPEKEVSDDGICPVVRALAERAASNFLLYCDFVEDGGLRALLAMDKMFCFGDSDNAVELLRVAFEAVGFALEDLALAGSTGVSSSETSMSVSTVSSTTSSTVS